jgi:hypothetical protein
MCSLAYAHATASKLICSGAHAAVCSMCFICCSCKCTQSRVSAHSCADMGHVWGQRASQTIPSFDSVWVHESPEMPGSAAPQAALHLKADNDGTHARRATTESHWRARLLRYQWLTRGRPASLHAGARQMPRSGRGRLAACAARPSAETQTLGTWPPGRAGPSGAHRRSRMQQHLQQQGCKQPERQLRRSFTLLSCR